MHFGAKLGFKEIGLKLARLTPAASFRPVTSFFCRENLIDHWSTVIHHLGDLSYSISFILSLVTNPSHSFCMLGQIDISNFINFPNRYSIG